MVRRSSLTLVLSDESVHLTPVTPPESSFEVCPSKVLSGSRMGKLQLPLFRVNQLSLSLQIVESTSFIPPPLQLGLETYISYPLHCIVDFLGEDMILLEEFDVALGVGADGLRETNGDGVKVVKIDMGIALQLATDDGVVTPLDFDEVSDALAPIFLGDFEGIVGGAPVQFVAFWGCWEASSFPSTWQVSMYPLVGISTKARISCSLNSSGVRRYFFGFLTVFLPFWIFASWYKGQGIFIPCIRI